MAVTQLTSVDEFIVDARRWLADRLSRRRERAHAWGQGSDDVSVFHDLTPGEELALLQRLQEWQAAKWDAGYGALTWPAELGGSERDPAFERAFRRLEAEFETPPAHETFAVTVHLIAPTIRVFGTPEQQHRFIPRFLGGRELCCQLFSEPGAGSDLAAASTRAVRDGDDWVITGQKVWSSGAQFSSWGAAICRTDTSASKHAGLTAFLIPMDAPGVQVRPIRQMSGGASFNEVFLTDVRIPDALRLGERGQGWSVALTTLGFERGSSGGGGESPGGSWPQLVGLARWLERTDEPIVRQALARAYTDHRLRQLLAQRVAGAERADAVPGPEGSIGKLLWTEIMRRTTCTVSLLLGPRLLADSGEWGTYAWADHVLGAPGYRIAGGSDEVQRNIIGERVLGLPREPRAGYEGVRK